MVDSTDTRCPGPEDASVTALTSASTSTPRTSTVSGRAIRRCAANALPKLFPDEPVPSRQDFAGRRSTFRNVRTDLDLGRA
ncbi:hypothetical protein ACFV0D_00375 [Streptomyces sp. NPDC059556]|uniref:hypothetical protein n=1 Tax=Streptomyces sp. NPDC059556 TaxID=3346863 RepID=UPI0036A2680D